MAQEEAAYWYSQLQKHSCFIGTQQSKIYNWTWRTLSRYNTICKQLVGSGGMFPLQRDIKFVVEAALSSSFHRSLLGEKLI